MCKRGKITGVWFNSAPRQSLQQYSAGYSVGYDGGCGVLEEEVNNSDI